MKSGAGTLANPHAVAIAVEAIAGFDGMAVGAKKEFAASESGDEDEEAGARKMKIGEQLIDDAEAVAGGDVEGRFRAAGEEDFGAGLAVTQGEYRGGVFEGANDGGADGEDGTVFAASAMDREGGFLGNLVGFAMDLVVFDAVGVDGLERAETDFQSELGDFDAAVAEAGHDRGAEMQAGGGRGGGDGVAGENRLVALAVERLIGAANIGRQGHVTEAFERGFESLDGVEAQYSEAVGAASEHFGGEVFAEQEALAGADFAARAHESFPAARSEAANKKDFDVGGQELAARARGLAGRFRGDTGAAGEEAGGQDTGVIDDQKLVSGEEIGQLAEPTVLPESGGAVEDEHARGIALRQRLCGDMRIGQGVIELAEQQNFLVTPMVLALALGMCYSKGKGSASDGGSYPRSSGLIVTKPSVYPRRHPPCRNPRL